METARSACLEPLDFTRVAIFDGFFGPRMETNRKVTTNIQYHHLKSTGRLDGIDPEYKPGDRSAHHIFWDSDVAKWIETAAYTLASHSDPELEEKVTQVIEKFAKLQQPDGYINSWFTSCEPDKRFTNLRDRHELYCAGHLMEAAVAWFRATGKRRFLDIMCCYADYIDSVFGREEGKIRGYPGHEEIELALIKLYHASGNERYLNLAKYFVDERGQSSQYSHYYDFEARLRGEDPLKFNYEYCQAHLPVREQKRVVGHAVRAMYLYSAMADLARETGDTRLIEACRTLWEDLCLKQMYVTGGIGQSRGNEGFTFHYDLPEETAYCETCAAVGLIFWSHRLLQIEKDSQYADVMERALYNGALSGVSFSGEKFFYVNPLASLGDHHRQEWFGCACCPGNISRLIASLGGYIYSVSRGNNQEPCACTGLPEVWIHLYTNSTASLDFGRRMVRLEQKTRYPWDGRVEINVGFEDSRRRQAEREQNIDRHGCSLNGVEAPETIPFTLALRIPGWCRNAWVEVNGERICEVSRGWTSEADGCPIGEASGWRTSEVSGPGIGEASGWRIGEASGPQVSEASGWRASKADERPIDGASCGRIDEANVGRINGVDSESSGEYADLGLAIEKGYLKISRKWHDGDRVVFELAMPVERVYANPRIRMYNGKVAIQRGPIVYCLEEVDNQISNLSCISIPRHSELSAHFDPDLLGGVMVITGEAEALALGLGVVDSSMDKSGVGDSSMDDSSMDKSGMDKSGMGEAAMVDSTLVDSAGSVAGEVEPLYRYSPASKMKIRITAVPYYAWDNREPGQMLVWIRE